MVLGCAVDQLDAPRLSVDRIRRERTGGQGAKDRHERGVGLRVSEARAQMRAQIEQGRAFGVGARGTSSTRRSSGSSPGAVGALARTHSRAPGLIDVTSGGPSLTTAEHERGRDGHRSRQQSDGLDACLGSFPHAATMAAGPVTNRRAM